MVNGSERIFGGRRLHQTRDGGVSRVRRESTPIRRRGYHRRKELSRIYATEVFNGTHDPAVLQTLEAAEDASAECNSRSVAGAAVP